MGAMNPRQLEAGVRCQSSLLVPVGEVEEAERAPKLPSLVDRCSVGVIKTNLSKFCLKCDPSLTEVPSKLD